MTIDGLELIKKPLDLGIRAGSLTVFVGPQGSGKSIALMALYLLSQYNFVRKFSAIEEEADFLEEYFASPGVVRDVERFLSCRQGDSDVEHMVYIPAQRSMLLLRGTFPPFEVLEEYPFVVRYFSHSMYRTLAKHEGKYILGRDGWGELFPNWLVSPVLGRIFSTPIGNLFPRVVKEGTAKKIVGVTSEGSKLPISSFSTGQRESLIVLMGLLRAMEENMQVLIVEEPEIGLHLLGVISLFLLILHLAVEKRMAVFLSTHSSVILSLLWGFKYARNGSKLMEWLFRWLKLKVDVDSSWISDALRVLHDSKVLYFSHGTWDDISSLDVVDGDWGGLLLPEKFFEIVGGVEE